MKPLAIAIVAHGRFHAFDLTRELQRRGHDVTVFTNYPRRAVARFGVAPDTVRSVVWHGGLTRLAGRLPGGRTWRADAWRHRAFGRWAARALAGRRWDVVHGWSGVSEEWLTASDVRVGQRILMRGSAHIVAQDAILGDEERRTGRRLERPGPWMIARERREYAEADRVLVLSTFARRSFEQQGHPADRIAVLGLGVDVARFRPAPGVAEARRQRLLGGAPLRVLSVGAVSYRKGLQDLMSVVRACDDVPVEFRLVGGVAPEAVDAVRAAANRITVAGRVAEARLPEEYARADLFLFPTLEDGFGMVLAQARAAGLPVIATTNCAAPDLLDDGRNGWIVPIRSPEAIVDRLRWGHAHRDRLAAVADAGADHHAVRDWAAVAEAFEAICLDGMPAASTVETAAEAGR